jgi:transcriptional regulator with XRE-family HTH domain
MATVGEALAAGRKRAGLSQKDLAARILKDDGTPLSPQYLNNLERNPLLSPSPHLLRQFADQLNLSYEYLLFLARDYPDDVRDEGYTPEDVEAAFAAFRRALREGASEG